MGAISEEGSGQLSILEAHHLIGRSDRCSLQLTEATISIEHASLRWTGRSWGIKDLASRFGTFVNGQRLDPGRRVSVYVGARLAFGREKHVWVVTDDGPPATMVIPMDGPEPRHPLFPHDGMIAIPSAERPAAILSQDLSGRWILDQSGQTEYVKENQPFIVEGVRWKLCNTAPPPSTATTGDARHSMVLDEAQLRFKVSRNEEHVQVEVVWRDRTIDLGARAHHYLLLTLARLREIEPGEDVAPDGWIDQEELLGLLQLTPERLNVEIFRLRRQFSAAGFIPAAGIIERRPGTKELRLGVAGVTIDSV